MAKVIIMPKLGYTQEEGELIEWHKGEGEPIRKGEAFFDVQTDKSVITVEATEDGTVLKLLAEPGAVMPVFTPVAVIGQPGEDPGPAAADAPEEPRLKLTPKARRLMEEEQLDPRAVAKIRGTGFEGGITAKDIKASPLARKIADDIGVDLGTVRGSGVHGKIQKADVLRAAASGPEEKRIAKTEPYRGSRKIIGDRLSQSKFTAPHLYFSDSVDTAKLSELRELINREGGFRVSLSDLLIVAAGKMLRRCPELNASLQDGQIVTWASVNIGTAVAGDAGLLVPVVKNVQEKSLREIAEETRDLFGRARKGQLRPEEYQNGTFTVSNLGMAGIEDFTAIINPPEAAILAVSSIRKKPVVVTGESGEDRIAIRPMMNIRLSVDHRLIDGMLAAQAVGCLKKLLENPMLLLL